MSPVLLTRYFVALTELEGDQEHSTSGGRSPLSAVSSSSSSLPPTPHDTARPLPLPSFSSSRLRIGLRTHPLESHSTPVESTASTPTRLRSLPRLLSNDAYRFSDMRVSSSAGAAAVEAEMETDSDEGEDDEEMATSPEEIEVATRTGSISAASTRSASRSDSRSPPPSSNTSVESTPSTTDKRPTPFRASTPSRPFAARPPAAFGSSSRNGLQSATHDVTPTTHSTNREQEGMSYFDLPRRSTPALSPLVPMSLGREVRGQRPTRVDEAVFTSSHENGGAGGDVATVARGLERTLSHHRRSRSAVDLLRIGLGETEEAEEDEEERSVTAERRLEEFNSIWQSPGGPVTPAPAFISPPTTDSALASTTTLTRPSTALLRSITRPRSMYELHIAPPVYHTVYSRPGANQIVVPREDEGREKLPNYTCSVHIEGYYPRKVEFSSPNVQCKDRAWKRQYFVLHGTSIKIFKYDLRTHPIEGEEDWSQIAANEVGTDETNLFFHEGEYGDPSASGNVGFMHEAKAKAKSKLPSNHSVNAVVREYSLQNAESGLAADYVKRKHVVRVRADGEQVRPRIPFLFSNVLLADQ